MKLHAMNRKIRQQKVFVTISNPLIVDTYVEVDKQSLQKELMYLTNGQDIETGFALAKRKGGYLLIEEKSCH